MLLNGGKFNARVVNGSRRLPVYAAAEAIAGFTAKADGRVEVRGAGDAHYTLGSALAPSALRRVIDAPTAITVDTSLASLRAKTAGLEATFATETPALEPLVYRVGLGDALLVDLAVGLPAEFRTADGLYFRTADGLGYSVSTGVGSTIYRAASATSLTRLRMDWTAQATRIPGAMALPVGLAAELDISATRNATSVAALSLLSTLFYSRTQYGDGSLILEIGAAANVGVQFGSGDAALHPMLLALAPNRRRSGTSQAEVVQGAALAPSAVRRFGADANLHLRYAGALEPAHVTAGGVRYITPDARLRLPLEAEDAGFQLYAIATGEPLLLSLSGGGQGARGRTAQGQPAAMSLLANVAMLRAIRMTESPIIAGLQATGAGEIYVRGDGHLVLETQAAGGVDATRFITGDALVSDLTGDLMIQRYRVGTGQQAIELVSTMTANRRRLSGGFLQVRPAELEGQMRADRRTTGEALLHELAAAGSGDILVRATGEAAIALAGELTGYRRWYTDDLGEQVLTVIPDLPSIRWLIRYPALPVATLGATNDGARGRVGDATLVIEALSQSSAALNIGGLDVDSQTFVRPATERDFVRPYELREFARAA